MTTQRPYTTVEIDVGVKTKQGISIDAWLRFHSEKHMARVVSYKGKLANGQHLVTISYRARGADSSDIMRPYRETGEWRRLADVVQIGESRYKKEDADAV